MRTEGLSTQNNFTGEDKPELSQPSGCFQMGTKVLPSWGINLLRGINQGCPNLWDAPKWIQRCYCPRGINLLGRGDKPELLVSLQGRAGWGSRRW